MFKLHHVQKSFVVRFMLVVLNESNFGGKVKYLLSTLEPSLSELTCEKMSDNLSVSNEINFCK